MNKGIDKGAIEKRIYEITIITKELKLALAPQHHILKMNVEKLTLLEVLEGKYDCND